MISKRTARELRNAVLVILLGTFFLVLFISGASWVTYKLLPLFQKLAILALGFGIIVVLPLSIPRRTRGLSSAAIFVLSYIFGATLWIDSFQLALSIWGVGAVIIGLVISSILYSSKAIRGLLAIIIAVEILLDIGMVPIALLATTLNGMWKWVIEIILLVIATFGCRALALHLLASVENTPPSVRPPI